MRAFFDTNILLYRVDDKSPAKRPTAQALLDQHYQSGEAIISTQVLQEFYNIATGKFRILPDLALQIAKDYARASVLQVTPTLIFAAMQRHAGGQFSFWDALIVEAALAGGASVLYTEDLQHGQVINGLAITNPFLAG